MKHRQTLCFGVAGNPPNFWASSHRTERANSPRWLHEIGLDALEIQCTYGVRMPIERAKAFRAAAERYSVRLSIHGPYYITLGSENPDKVRNSLNELRKAIDLAVQLNTDRVVFHIGSPGGDRGLALSRAIDSLRRFEREVDLGSVRLFPEIDGRRSWLGSLEEVLEVCANVRSASPCLDLAHMHARTGGTLKTRADFSKVIDLVESTLGEESLNRLHFHMYPIQWNEKGEVTHKAFADVLESRQQLSLLQEDDPTETHYLPRYEPFLDALLERELSGTVICEAKDSQDVGALEMKRYHQARSTELMACQEEA